MRALLLGVITMLAACPLQKSTTLGGGSSSGGGGGDSAAQAAANDPDAMVDVPKVMGMTKEQADAALASAGFTHGVEDYPLTCDDPKPAPGTIECQDPAPGAKVKANAMIKISTLAPIDHSFFRPEDFDSLKGLTVAQAKAKAKQIGQTGDIKTRELDKFAPGCKPDTVCRATDEYGGQSGMGLGHALILETNKTLEIAPPPD